MNKHAYLILAHHQFELLARLCSLLDDERNDLYIHIDRKATDFDAERIRSCVQRAGLFFTERLDVRWGGFSQIEAELLLLKAATERGDYAYYHLLSGVDLPLKSQDEIHAFFAAHAGEEFIHIGDETFIRNQSRVRAAQYHFLQEHLGRRRSGALFQCERVSLALQRLLGVDRLKGLSKVSAGANWFSITDAFARYVLSREKFIRRHFRYTACADELFLQTLFVSSPFCAKRYCPDESRPYQSCLRFIDWTRGDPYTWQEGDYDELMGSDYLFARKFDWNTQRELCERVFAAVSKR